MHGELLFDREPPPVRPVVVLECSLGASRRQTYPVKLPADDLRGSAERRPCNNGLCEDRRCPAFSNWTAEEIIEAFQ